MKLKLLSPLVVAMLISVGCASPQTRTQLTTLRPFAGNYFRGDGTCYNISLDLRPDGSYGAQWSGCLGIYGTARGKWSIDGDQILLSPRKETDMMKGHLTRLDISKYQGGVILIPTDDREFYDEHGPSRMRTIHSE